MKDNTITSVSTLLNDCYTSYHLLFTQRTRSETESQTCLNKNCQTPSPVLQQCWLNLQKLKKRKFVERIQESSFGFFILQNVFSDAQAPRDQRRKWAKKPKRIVSFESLTKTSKLATIIKEGKKPELFELPLSERDVGNTFDLDPGSLVFRNQDLNYVVNIKKLAGGQTYTVTGVPLGKSFSS